MKVGDLVKLWLNAEWSEIGIIINRDVRTCPEKIYVRTLDGRIVQGYDEECEVLNAA